MAPRTLSSPRQFRAVIGPGLAPVLRDASGAILKDLPPPGAKDDPAKAAEAQKEWRLFKKLLKQTAAAQSLRLEAAMLGGRRWSLEAFREYILGHPLMVHLARALVWERYDAKGNPLPGCFRPAEDASATGPDERPMDLGSTARVGLVHPLRLCEAELGQWGRILSDYEIVQPFPQIGREVFALEKGEEKSKELTRFAKERVPAPAMIRILDGRGWAREANLGGGGFDRHAKYFAGAKVTAVARHEPTSMMVAEDQDDLSLEMVYFLAGNVRPGAANPAGAIVLGEIDPVVMSETLRDTTAVAAKAK